MGCKYLQGAIVASLGILGVSAGVRACAPLPLELQLASKVRVVGESAIIIWDESKRTQHFIRRATFDANGDSIGFLVPTPNVPQLASADDAVWRQVTAWTLPEVRTQRRRNFRWTSLLSPAARETGAAPGVTGGADTSRVEVLHTQSVAGYDASVLAARDATALQRWLKAHGYASNPELIAWLQPYVARNWKITAFKIAKPKNGAASENRFGSSAVRMSFSTDTPFFPYREPANQREGAQPTPRSLRIFLLATQRMIGAIGEKSNARHWPARTVWTNALTSERSAELMQTLKLPSAPANSALWMTAFEDFATPRPGFDDVNFSPAKDQSPIVPPPIVRYENDDIHVPLEIVLLFFSLAGYGVFRIARHRR